MASANPLTRQELKDFGITTGTVSPKDKKRIEELIDNEELLGFAMQGMAIRAQERAAGLQYRYVLGTLMMRAVKQLKSSVPIKQLGEAWQLDQDQAYHVARFAERYTDAQFRKLLDTNLSWSHVRVLVNMDDKKKRLELQREAVQKGWGYRDLSKAAQLALGTRSNNPAGRGVAIPKTVAGGVTKMRTMSQQFVRVDGEVFAEHVLGALDEIGPDSVTDELLEEVAGLRDDLTTLAAAASNDKDRADAALARLQEILDQRTAAGDESDAEASETPAKSRGKKTAAKSKRSTPAKKSAGGGGSKTTPKATGKKKTAAPTQAEEKPKSGVAASLKDKLMAGAK